MQRSGATNDYQRTKVAGLALARAAATRGVPIVSMVPGVIYGPGAATEGNLVGRLVHDHLAGRLPGIVGADKVWSFAYVDDVAAAHVAALTSGATGREYALGGDNAPQMRLFEILRRLRGTALPRRIPFAVASALGYVEERRAGLFGRPPLLTRGTVEIFRHDWPLDSSQSVQTPGVRPHPARTGAPPPAWSGTSPRPQMTSPEDDHPASDQAPPGQGWLAPFQGRCQPPRWPEWRRRTT